MQLKQLALSGELQRSNLRAVCWKVRDMQSWVLLVHAVGSDIIIFSKRMAVNVNYCVYMYTPPQLFLGCLPEEQDQWVATAVKSRKEYADLKKKVSVQSYMYMLHVHLHVYM